MYAGRCDQLRDRVHPVDEADGAQVAAVVSCESKVGQAEIHRQTGHLHRRERAVTAARDFIERDTVAGGLRRGVEGRQQAARIIMMKRMWPWSKASRIQKFPCESKIAEVAVTAGTTLR